MISVGSSDARKGLGLGFAGRGGKMKENELEEGEAFPYRSTDSYDSSIDPDIALFHIDEKLQDVLGHFQKDFEGGVSAENLGAKFGDHGSFLPTYQRSPVWSHPKSLLQVQNHSTPRSPENSNLQGSQPGCSALCVVPQVSKSGSISKGPARNALVKLKKCVKSSYTETSDIKQEFAAKNSRPNSSNQKTLKVRIKVGSNDLSSGKNVSIYSGLGLDVSPSTLLDDSLSGNEEGLFCMPHDSPTKILMAMISFPFHSDLLLSPLSDDLIQLGEKEEIVKDDSRYVYAAKLDSEDRRVLVDVSDSQKCDSKLPVAKKAKLRESIKHSPLSNKHDTRYMASKKEIGTHVLSCEELVSKTLRLPLLSCSCPIAANPTKGINKISDAYLEIVEDAARGMISNDLEAKLMDSKPVLEENLVAFSAQNVQEVENATFLNSTRKDTHWKGDEIPNSIESDSKGKKASNAKLVDSSMHKVSQRETGNQQWAAKSKHSGVWKKSRESPSVSIPAGESLRDESVGVHKTKKNACAKKLQKDIRGSDNRYKEIFGDVGESEEEKQMSPVDKIAKGKLSKRNASEESLSNKKTDEPLHSDVHLVTISDVAPPSMSKTVPDVARTGSASTMIEDNWVLCEKCQKWRLLPNGMNPDNFPEDWDCSMLNWLPGMNCCTVHQDVTTQAVLAMHQAPSVEVKGAMNSNVGRVKLLTNGQTLQNLGVGKKKKDLKEIANGTGTEGLNHPLLVSDTDFKHLSRSSDSSEDRHKIKRNDKWKALYLHSDEGEMRNSRMKSKMDPHRELFGTSKKPNIKKSQFYDIDQLKSNRFLKDAASNKTDKIQASAKKAKENANSSLHTGCDGRDALRKRKLKENQKIGDHMQGRIALSKKLSGKEIKKEKRLRVSRSDTKESHANCSNADLDRRAGQANNREFAPHKPPVVTASSSSKISISHKTQAKGSPVESVSSSPLRMSDPDKLKSGRRNLSGKDEPYDTSIGGGDGIQRCSDGEGYSGADRPGLMKKEQTLVQDENFCGLSSGKATVQVVHSAGEIDHLDQNGKLDDLGENADYSRKLRIKQSCYKERQHYVNCTRNESLPKKSGMGSSSPSRERKQDMVFKSEVQDLATSGEVKPNEIRSKKRPHGEVSIESSKEDSRGHHDLNAKLDANGSPCYEFSWKPDILKSIPGKSEQVEMTTENLKNKSVPPSRAGQQIEKLGQGGDVLNTQKQMTGNGNQNVNQDTDPRNPTQNGNRLKDQGALSALKKESTSQAVSNSIKEATNLKHMADRLKSAGSNLESTGFYFQAALKFLHGASLLESFGTEHAKHGNSARSWQIYGSTAKLCAFCAHEYEKSRDMAAAALAYKCMEVAYLRIIYSSHCSLSRCRYELQAVLQVTPSGESPSSASDIDNLSRSVTAEKVVSSKGVRSPKAIGNRLISSQNHSNLFQLLVFSQNVNFAMDASRKAQIAFAAAKGKSGDANYDGGISSIKRALDFNFQDMEGLLHVVRLAMEAINR